MIYIFQIYKNKISLNAAEIENKIQIKVESLKDNSNQNEINFIKEEINNSKFKIWKKNEELMLPLSKFQKNYNKIYAIVINKN